MANSIVSTGDLDCEYEVLGLVGTHVDNKDTDTVANDGCGGCGGNTATRVYVSVADTYKRGEGALLNEARLRGGNAVIYAKFEHRIAIETLQSAGGALMKLLKQGNGTTTSQVIELFCYGTAIKVKKTEAEKSSSEFNRDPDSV